MIKETKELWLIWLKVFIGLIIVNVILSLPWGYFNTYNFQSFIFQILFPIPTVAVTTTIITIIALTKKQAWKKFAIQSGIISLILFPLSLYPWGILQATYVVPAIIYGIICNLVLRRFKINPAILILLIIIIWQILFLGIRSYLVAKLNPGVMTCNESSCTTK